MISGPIFHKIASRANPSFFISPAITNLHPWPPVVAHVEPKTTSHNGLGQTISKTQRILVQSKE